jgi:hypothetical protein
MPHEPAGITATLAFAITRNFHFAFLTPEVYHQLPLLRFFFCIRSRANEPDALDRAFPGTKKPWQLTRKPVFSEVRPATRQERLAGFPS